MEIPAVGTEVPRYFGMLKGNKKEHYHNFKSAIASKSIAFKPDCNLVEKYVPRFKEKNLNNKDYH